MITLLSALLGLAGSALPDIFKWLNGKQDNAHELAVMGVQLELAKLEGQQRLEEINTQADIAESAALNDRVKPIGIKWVDALAASVRPILTYLFFLAYIAVKVAQYHMLTATGPEELPWLSHAAVTISWSQALAQIWTEEDLALFTTIICFWFGSRHMNKRAECQ